MDSPWSKPPPVPWIMIAAGPSPNSAYSIEPKRLAKTLLPVAMRARCRAISAAKARCTAPPASNAPTAAKPVHKNRRLCIIPQTPFRYRSSA
jgi:hypothetical protein